MAPTEGRVTKPERRWDCHHGTPTVSCNLMGVGITRLHSRTWSRHRIGLSSVLRPRQDSIGYMGAHSVMHRA